MSVLSTASLCDGLLVHNERTLARGEGRPDDMLRTIYQTLDLSYPKFHKMDTASKLALLAVEPLVAEARQRGADIQERLGLLGLSNSGSNAVDAEHWSTFVHTGTASPALFVYTLPNIGLGEITIRHGIHGVSQCLLGRDAGRTGWMNALRTMHQRDGMRWIVLVWSDIFADRCEARAALLGPGDGRPADEATLRDLFNPAS